ncbi:hypothetical protein SLS57_004152 [Botryosphaeria dothidea]
MLHVCFGFIFTVLSLLGVRVYFLTPTSLSNFLCSLRVQRESVRGSIRERVQAVQAAFQHLRDWLRSPSPDHHQQEQQNISPEPDPTIGKSTVFSKLVRNLRQVRGASYASSTWVNALTVKFTSDAVSFLKHPSLSWSGVAWRSAILSYLVGLNLWLWWSPWLHDKTTSSAGEGPTCATPIFFFGHRVLADGQLVFFRVVSVMLAIPALWLCWVILSAALAMWKFVLGFLARRLVIRLLESARPGTWDALHDGVKFGVGLFLTPFLLWDNIWPYAVIDVFLGTPVMLQGIFTFWTIKADELPGWSELAKPFISFMSRGVDLRDHSKQRRLLRAERQDMVAPVSYTTTIICGTFHVYNLATMICFIVFIEKTIIVAEVSGVYSLRSTGQLIPFIIGLASFAASIREITLLHMRKRYPDWHTRSLTFMFGPGPSYCDRSQELEKKDPTVDISSSVSTPLPSVEDPMVSVNRIE